MRVLVRLLTLLALIAGGLVLFRIEQENVRLSEEIRKLESELGRMPIDSPERIYLVEIKTPELPPEVASHVEHIWQFRCNLPPGYDFARMSGGGRVAREGVYQEGGFSTSSGSPNSEATHELFTISLQRKDDHLVVFDCFGGSAGTTSWNRFNPEQGDDSLAVQKLTAKNRGPRSFDQETILPILKVYDPSTSEKKGVDGETITTFAGGLFVLCPKSRQMEFDQLRKGETPDGFDPSWIASLVNDE